MNFAECDLYRRAESTLPERLPWRLCSEPKSSQRMMHVMSRQCKTPILRGIPTMQALQSDHFVFFVYSLESITDDMHPSRASRAKCKAFLCQCDRKMAQCLVKERHTFDHKFVGHRYRSKNNCNWVQTSRNSSKHGLDFTSAQMKRQFPRY